MARISYKRIKDVIQVAYHRNGVGGAGFHAVVFTTSGKRCSVCGDGELFCTFGGDGSDAHCMSHRDAPLVDDETKMLGVVFDSPCHCAVFDISKLGAPAVGVAFGSGPDGNSWRGDVFEDELRAAIRAADSDGSEKVGPFAVPAGRKRKR